MNPSARTGAEVLLTGATGFVGKVVLHELIRRSEELGIAKIHLLIRGTVRSDPQMRWRSEIAASPCFADLSSGWERRVTVVEAELSHADAGIDAASRAALAERITAIIHCAASVEFDLPIEEAATANITGALNMLELAHECTRLTSMVCVSTAYVTPHSDDDAVVEERLAPLPIPAREIYASILDGSANEADLLKTTRHPNTYTLTKCIAEHLISEYGIGLPITFVRPSIISASLARPCPGWIDSAAAFAFFIMSIAMGRTRAMIANPNANVDIVPVDYVADRILDSAFSKRSRTNDEPTIHHAVVGFERNPTMAICLRGIEEFFQRNPVEAVSGRDAFARVRYFGPDGPAYQRGHLRYHCSRPDARLLAGRLDYMNQVFAYFTQRTFRFAASMPFDDPEFECHAYIETVCRGVADHLMDADESRVSLAGRHHPKSRSDLRWALGQPHGSALFRAAGYAVVRVLRRCTDRVTFDWRAFESALAERPDGVPLVIVPTHRSYLDYVLISFLAFARPDLRIGIPHVAAVSEFSRIPLLGRVLRGLQAFYVGRGSEREEKDLMQHVQLLIGQGQTIELFIEGHRSRNRRFEQPRRGVLRSLQATGERVALLPVSISYERVPEETGFVNESLGSPAAKPRLRSLLRWAVRALRHQIDLGSIHIAADRLLLLDMRCDVREVTHGTMAALQSGVVTTSRQLRAFLDAEAATLDDVDLGWLQSAIERRGGRVLSSNRERDPLPAFSERCARHQFEHLFYADAVAAYPGNLALDALIRDNGYAMPNRESGDADDPRVRRVVDALFTSVFENFAAATETAAGPDVE